jgi:hypothetical protein
MALKEWKGVQTVSWDWCPSQFQANTRAVIAEELEITMKMLGVSSLDQLGPDMVNTSRLANEMWRPVFGNSKL